MTKYEYLNKIWNQLWDSNTPEEFDKAYKLIQRTEKPNWVLPKKYCTMPSRHYLKQYKQASNAKPVKYIK